MDDHMWKIDTGKRERVFGLILITCLVRTEKVEAYLLNKGLRSLTKSHHRIPRWTQVPIHVALYFFHGAERLLAFVEG
jgi:hypothetical protein